MNIVLSHFGRVVATLPVRNTHVMPIEQYSVLVLQRHETESNCELTGTRQQVYIGVKHNMPVVISLSISNIYT